MKMAKILLIEDNNYTSKLYKEKLQQEGYDVEVVKTGEQGMIAAKEVKPDLILLDIMLPGGVNGFDVLENLRKQEDLKTLPVIVLTNLDTEEKVAKEIGVSEYIVKANMSLEQLVDIVKKYLK